MRTLLFLMLALLTLAPLAAAQETNETPSRPDDAAWVEDCPPDMMCAASSEEKAPEEGADDGRVYKDGEPVPYGDEACIECSGPAPADGANCMDGQQEGETCRDDVYYMTPPGEEAEPTRGPEDGSCENCRGDAQDGTGDEVGPINSHAPGAEGDGGVTSVQDEDANTVPAAGFGLIVAAFAVAVVLVARKL